MRLLRAVVFAGVALAAICYLLGGLGNWIGLKIAAGGVVFCSMFIYFRWVRSWEQSRSREVARVIDELMRLDDRYTLLYNWTFGVKSPREVGLVLVGPGGILVIECKLQVKAVRCERDQWSVRRKSGEWCAIRSFSTGLKRSMRLVEQQVGFPVTGAFVFSEEADVETVLPNLRVFRCGDLTSEIQRLPLAKAEGPELLGALGMSPKTWNKCVGS